MKIKISDLVFDRKLYPRVEINASHVARLAQALRAGFVLPPIVVEEGTNRIVDGAHRVQAYRQEFGEDAKIEFKGVSFASEAEFFLAAVAANSSHGLTLDPLDRTELLIRAAQLGLTREAIASALKITPEKAERILNDKTAFRREGDSRTTIALKGSMKALRGQDLTPVQVSANEFAGGMQPLYYVNQLISLVDSGLWDWGGESVRARLLRLHELLEERTKNAVGV